MVDIPNLTRVEQVAPAVLNGHGELRAIAEVVERMCRRFPEIGRDTVEAVVDGYHHEYDGRPIREFVPILVERDVTEHLRALDGHGDGSLPGSRLTG